jgi:MerR family transcriptional regulator, light-induced transcriptional regulator
MFERLSAEPIYNTRAVVRRTGVPADTFRAWERRYGVPAPLRTEGNQRLYSERDIRTITWLREQTAVGLTISQAILLMRSNKNPAPVPTPPTIASVDHHIEEALTGKRSSTGDPLISARRRLLESFTRLDGQSAEHILQETYAWADLEIVLVELLHGAMLDVYDRPELRPPYSPVAHFARSFVQRKFASLYNLSNPNDGRGPILSTAVEGEDHDLTLLLSAVFLSRAGFRMVFLGPNLPFDAFTAAIRIVRPAAVCLAATTEPAVATLREWQTRLSTHNDGSSTEYGRLPVCFSGRVFVDQPELRDQIDGSFLGRAAQDSVAVVEAAIANHRG